MNAFLKCDSPIGRVLIGNGKKVCQKKGGTIQCVYTNLQSTSKRVSSLNYSNQIRPIPTNHRLLLCNCSV